MLTGKGILVIKSTSDYCNYLGDNLIQLRSKKQMVLALSSTKSKCVDLSQAVA